MLLHKLLRRTRGGLRIRQGDFPFRMLMLASGATVVFTILVLAAMLVMSAGRSDQLTETRHHRVVEYALAESITKVPYDQESVAVWDDAVKNVKTFDAKWVDINLGVWMYDYFKHDRTYVLNADNQVLYSMSDGKEMAVSRRLPVGKIAEQVAKLRRIITSGALDRYDNGQERVPRAVDLGFVEGRPAIVSVMPFVSDTGEMTQTRGTEGLIVSVRFIEVSFLPDLANAYLLEGVRFSKDNRFEHGEQSIPLRNQARTVIGHIMWKPNLPGRTILADLGPLFGMGSLAIGLAFFLLIRSLRRTCTELVASDAHSKHLAYHDVLTGLANRALFNETLEKCLAQVRSTREQMALLFLDLDRFKQVNDTFGHGAGDALIRDVSAQLCTILGPGDFLARIGGDEFAVIKRSTSKEEVEAFSREIVKVVSRPFFIGEGTKTASIGISVGAVMTTEAGTDSAELARKADIALYHAKTSTGERFQFFTDEMGARIQSRHDLEMELRHALETGRGLEVVYQPVYAAGHLKPSGAEALARWVHPRLGPISPLVFIALAEECGLIDSLGDWVIRKACGVAQAWDLDTIAVNVSTVQCQQSDFAERVFAILRDCGLSPRQLEIEITESVLLDSSGASAKTLKALRDGGVSIALDDFGTGYSSLSYLLKLDVDRIKIDRSFVQHLDDSAQSRSIIQAIVTMAKAVNVAVTAEGIETHKQLSFLCSAGCDHLQGYLLSKPISAPQLTKLLSEHRSQSFEVDAA